jgi:alkylhydroperoxidase family enzyme
MLGFLSSLQIKANDLNMTNEKRQPAWIKTIHESEASGEVKRAYQRAGDANTDNVDHIMKIHSLNPKSLIDHLHLYKTLMHGESPLSKVQREMIGVVVSAINRCEY